MAKKIKKNKPARGNFKKGKKRKKGTGSQQEGASLQSLLQRAINQHKAGRLHEAELQYRQVLASDPHNPDALHYLGMLAYQAGNNEIAVDLICKAIQYRPDYVNALNSLGIVFNAQGKFDEAVNSYRRALKLKPDYAEALNNLGNTYTCQGKLDQAVTSFKQAVSLKPDFAQAYYNLGNAYRNKDSLKEAIVSFRQAITLQPEYIDAHNRLGISLSDQGRLDEAIGTFRQAITLKPENAETYNNLGVSLSLQGKLEDAVSNFRKALKLKPDYVEAIYNLGNALKDQDKLQEAIAAFQRVLTLNPNYAEAHYNLGFIFRQLGEFNDAKDCFKKAILLKPDYVMAFKGLATIVKHTEVDDAILAMENLFDNKEELPDADRIGLGFALAKIYEDIGDYERSFKFIEEANRLKRVLFEYSSQREYEYFERIKKIFSHDFFASHSSWGNQDGKPIFILGMPRSGTTLVEQILASHSLVFGAGEVTVLEELTNTYCSVGEVTQFPECILDFDEITFEKMGFEYLEKMRELANGEEYITDKMLYNFLRVGLIKTILPNARVIHCNRNPMDICFSIFKRDFIGVHGYGYDMIELGRYFNLYQDLMIHWEKVLPGFMYTISYEELVADQQNQTRNLLDFCGLPWEDACLTFYKTKRRVRTASLAQVRKPIYTDSVELWKRYEKQLEPLRKAIYG